jgi:hypothetical protein
MVSMNEISSITHKREDISDRKLAKQWNPTLPLTKNICVLSDV